MYRLFLLALALSLSTAVSAQVTTVVINEINAAPGTSEFIELYDGGTGNTPLDGLVLVLFNGSNGVAYSQLDLDGFSTDANGFIVFGEDPAATVDFPDAIQDGPDAVALYVGDASDFPDGTAPTQTNLVDAYNYGTNDGRNDQLNAQLLSGLGLSVLFDEAFGDASAANVSLQRLNDVATDGSVTGEVSRTLYIFPPTPGALNPSSTVVDVTDEVNGTDGDLGVDEAKGWRMVAVPGFEPGDGTFEVDDLADINLVQGVAAGPTSPAQYPGRFPNIFTSASGVSTGDATNGYNAPASTDESLLPGAGLIWYFYDVDVVPAASRSYDLANPDFELAIDAVPPDEDLLGGTPYTLTVPAVEPYTETTSPKSGVPATRFFLIGNPGGYAYVLGGIEFQGGINDELQETFYVWNPDAGTTQSQGQTIAGSFEIETANFDSPFAGEALGRWNGAFAEVVYQAGDPGPNAVGTFSFSSDFYRPSSEQGFTGLTSAEERLPFRLEGTLEDGTPVVDVAAMLRFRSDATLGWDRMDATKPNSLASNHALIAPVGSFITGQPRRQGPLSLPAELTESVTVPVAFLSTGAGSFKLSWDLSQAPADHQFLLRDVISGEELDLRVAPDLAFSADATEWTDRFELVITPRSVVSSEPGDALAFSLSAPAPNPSRSLSSLTLKTAEAGPVHAAVYDALGREVAVLHEGVVAAGTPVSLVVRTSDLAPGVYVVRAQAPEGTLSHRLTVVR